LNGIIHKLKQKKLRWIGIELPRIHDLLICRTILLEWRACFGVKLLIARPAIIRWLLYSVIDSDAARLSFTCLWCRCV